MFFLFFLNKLSPPFSRQSERKTRRCHFAQIISFFVLTNNKNENQAAQFDPSDGPFFPFWNWYSCRESDGGGRWRTARAGKSCVKPVATADLFNPAVHEWSTQTGIYRRVERFAQIFPNNLCFPILLDLMWGSVWREHFGENDSPLCGASMALLSGSCGMQRSRNLGCSLP